MKKYILIFLLLTSFLQAQTYQNPTFGTISSKTNVKQNDATRVIVQDSISGKLNWVLKSNLPISTDVNAALQKKISLPTGFVSGLQLSINADPTKINIAAGFYTITDYSSLLNPIVAIKTFSGLTGVTPAYLTTANASYIALDINGNVIQSSSPFTNSDRRTLAIIGAAIHSNLTTVNVTNEIKAPIIAISNQLHDLMRAIGFLNEEGNIYSSNGANLMLNKSSGKISGLGINANDYLNPNQLTIGSQTALTFAYRLRGGSQFANTQNIDPNNYDNAGVLTAVTAGNKWTIPRINLFQSGLARVQYGQTVYNSYAEALNALRTEIFVTEQNISENAIFRSYLIVKQGTTDLSAAILAGTASFHPVDKFGNITGNSSIALTFDNIIAALGYTPENLANKATNFTVVNDVLYPSVQATKTYVDSKIPTTFSQIVYVNAVSPTTATIFDLANPPVTNNDALKIDVNNLYIGTDASTWVYITSPAGYVTKTVTSSTSNFYLSGTTTDAGNNKTGAIGRVGQTFIGSTTGNSTDAFQVTGRSLFNGNVVIGTTTSASMKLRILSSISGGATAYGFFNQGMVQSDVTTAAYYNRSQSSTQAVSFNLPVLNYYAATQGTFGAGSTVTVQNGFLVESNLIGATNNFGFRSQIPSGTNNWNIYADGTAKNHFNGTTLIGTTTDNGIDKVQIVGSTAQTGQIKSTLATGTAPLSVASTTVVTNLNADMVDGVHASALAPLASPVFTGNPTVPTPTSGDNDTSIATTAFVTGAINTSDATNVKTSGNQLKTGVLTFNNSSTNLVNGIELINSGNTNDSYSVLSTNTGTGEGFHFINTSSGKSINIVNTNVGTGLNVDNSSTGLGLIVNNGGVGTGQLLVNQSSGTGLNINNALTGKSIVLNNLTGATGTPFTISKNSIEKFTITDGGLIKLGIYTVDTLPTPTGTAYATVSDALSPQSLQSIVGGGAIFTPVFYNGTSWVSISTSLPKQYEALISQSSTGDPTVTVLQNTTGGTIVWTRTTTGNYVGTLTGAFTANKTACFNNNTSNGSILFQRASDNTVTLVTPDLTGTNSDGKLTNTTIKIEIYP